MQLTIRKQHPLDTRRHRPFNWSRRLPGLTILQSEWESTPAGLSITGDEPDGLSTSAFISGAGGTYTVTNRVIAGGETLDESFTLKVAEERDRLFNKDPDATEVFAVEWAYALDGDTIDSFTFSINSGPDDELVKFSEYQDGTVTLVKLSGGTVGATYRVLARIESTGGQTLHQALDFYIAEE